MKTVQFLIDYHNSVAGDRVELEDDFIQAHKEDGIFVLVGPEVEKSGVKKLVIKKPSTKAKR
jgi:hypothetical protein